MAALQAEALAVRGAEPGREKVIADSLSGQAAELEPVVARTLQRSAPSRTPRRTRCTVVVLAVFQGLARRRLLDPATVPDDLLARALRWLFAGLSGEHRAGVPLFTTAARVMSR